MGLARTKAARKGMLSQRGRAVKNGAASLGEAVSEMATLRTLRIRNLVIIEDLTVDFGPGLNMLTGETGAGKSILVDALDLIAGARADRSLVRAGEERAIVEALFDLEGDARVGEWLIANGIAPEAPEEVLIHRDVASKGAGRVRVNGSPCTLALLGTLGRHLLELHGQHEEQSLLAADHPMQVLDRFGAHGDACERVRLQAQAVRDRRAELTRLEEAARDRAERVARLQETLRDVDELDPKPGELDSMAQERRVLQNSTHIAELADRIVAATAEGEGSLSERSASAARDADRLAELDPSQLELAERLRSLAVELQDVGAGYREYRDRADFDPGRLEALEARRTAIERICLRYGAEEAELVERRETAATELAQLESLDERTEHAAAEAKSTEHSFVAAAAELTRAREAAGGKLVPRVKRQFKALALDQADFSVHFGPARGEALDDGTPLNAAGVERVEFHLAANPGEPARPLAQVASGGELSRVMLALHVVADTGSGRVLVFDEVDSGVGGRVADAIGARLGRLAQGRQILCLTHLPQVAAHADQHFRVEKQVTRGRTRTAVASLGSDQRVDELARMLGGKKPTPASRRHAGEMLQAAGNAVKPRRSSV